MKVNQLPFEILGRMITSADFSNLDDKEKITTIQLMSGIFSPETVKEKIIFQNYLN